MNQHTPTPWTGFTDEGKCIAIMPAGREGDICTFGVPPSDADADFILTAVNNHVPMVKSLEQCAKLFDTLAQTLDRWATQSQTGGWSTHQVDENIKRANDCRRYANTIRSALPSRHDQIGATEVALTRRF